MSIQNITNTRWTNIIKQTSESRASTTTVTSDADLVFTIGAAGLYVVEACVFYFCEATPDFKFRWNTPALNAAWVFHEYGSNLIANTISYAGSGTSLNADITMAAGGTQFGTIMLRTRLNTSASGTFAFQFAQGTSDAASVVVQSGSWLRWAQVGA